MILAMAERKDGEFMESVFRQGNEGFTKKEGCIQ